MNIPSWQWITIILFTIFFLYLAAGSDDVENDLRVVQKQKVKVMSTAEKLASLEIGHNSPPKDLVNKFDLLLNETASKCPENSKEEIGNFAFKIHEIIQEKGKNISFYDSLQGINGSIPKDAAGIVSCTEIGSAFITLYLSQ